MDDVYATIKDFVKDYWEYMPPEIPVLHKPPTACEFLNNHVLPNSPVIIKPLGGYFPEARKEWDLLTNMKIPYDHSITVAATPDGRADSIVDDKFMIPEERKIPFIHFAMEFDRPTLDIRKPVEVKMPGLPEDIPNPAVFYVQKQNNNLIDEFALLLPLLSKDVPWATEAFGSPPEAANIWMGHKQSFTSMHKDHYENIYFVIKGTKTFRLFPPIDIYWMPYGKFPKFQWYQKEDLTWGKTDLKEEVTWIRSDMRPETRRKFHLMLEAKSYTVTINPGEALYLPAMWFHEVTQSDRTIAVNYWYDMTYEVKFPYYCLVDALGKLPFSRKDASTDTQHELESELADDIIPRITSKSFQKKIGMKKASKK